MLSKSFEVLAQYNAPQAYFHCVQLGVHPLTLVFSWIFTAFTGVLPVSEVTYLLFLFYVVLRDPLFSL